MEAVRRNPVLITPTMIRCLKAVVKSCEKLYLFPIVWDNKRKEPVNRKSKTLYRAKSVYMLTFSAYVVTRASMADWTRMKFSKQVESAVVLVIYFFVPLLELVHLRISSSWCTHVTRSIGFARVLEATILAEQKQPSRFVKIAEKAALMGVLTMPVNTFFFAIHALVMRESPESLYPVFSYLMGGNPSAWHDLWIMAVMLPMQYYVLANIGSLGISCMITSIYDVLVLDAGMAYLRSVKDGRGVLFSSLQKTWKDRIQLYSNMSLIVGEMGKLYWVLSAVTQYIIMIFATLGIFTLIRIGGYLGLMIGASGTMATTILLIIFNYLAKFPKDSQKTLDTWKRQGELVPLEFRKRIKALTPLKYRLGNLYFVDKMLLLTICKITIENAIVMLISN